MAPDKLESDAILHKMFDPVIRLNANLGIELWNRSAQQLTGINESSALGKHIFTLIPSLQEECEYLFNVAILKEHREIELQMINFEKPTSKTMVSARARFFPVGEQGGETKIIVIFHAPNTLNGIELNHLNLMKSVIVNTNDAVLITDAEPVQYPNGPKIIYSNPAFTKMTGYSAQEVNGLTPRLLQGEDTSKDTKREIRKSLENWKPISCEIKNYRKNGDPFWVDLDIVPVLNQEGFYTHWIAIQRESTAKRLNAEKLKDTNKYLNEKVKERTKELESFSYFLAHDLRTPVNNIINLVGLIKRKKQPLDPTLVECLKLLEESTYLIHDIINGLTQITIYNHSKVTFSNIHFESVIKDAIQNLQDEISTSQAKVVWDDLPSLLLNKEMMVTTTQNLISNAIKYCSEKAPFIEISSETTHNEVIIRFKDNGIGFGELDGAKAMELFARGESSREKRGFGLGLTICEKAVKKQKGYIQIFSNQETGSMVELRFPKEGVEVR